MEYVSNLKGWLTETEPVAHSCSGGTYDAYASPSRATPPVTGIISAPGCGRGACMPDGTRQDALDGALQLLIDDVTAKYADLLRHKPGQRDVEEDVLKLLPTRDFEFQRNELVRGWTRRLKNRIGPLLESHLRDDARDTSANIALSLKNSAEYALLCEEIDAEVQTAVERLQGKSWLWTPGHSGASLDESRPLASVPDGHASSSSSDDESSHSRAANANAISSPMEWMDTSTVCSQSCVTTVSFSSLPSLDRVPPLLDQVVNGNADEATRVASLEGLRVFTATEVVANSQWSRILGVLQEDRHPNLQQSLVAYLASLFDSAVPDVQAADILLAYMQHLQTIEAAPAGRHMRLLLYMLHRIPQVWPSISESVADHLVETTLSLASKADALLAFAKLDPPASWLERWMLVGCTRWALLRSARLKQFIETVYATAGPDVPLYNICLICHLGRFKMARRLMPSTALGRLMNLVADIWAEDARATKNALYPFIVRVLTAPVVPGTTTDIHKAARMLREHALDGRRCATGVLALKVMDALSNNSHTAHLVTEGDFVCCLIERIHHSAHSIPFTAAAVDLLFALCQRRRVVNSWRQSPIASAIARSLDTEALRPVAESALLALASSSAGCSIIIDHSELFAEPFRRLLSGASTSRLHRPELCNPPQAMLSSPRGFRMLGECGLIEHHIRGLRQCIEHHHRGMRPISKATACRRRLVDAIMSAGVHFQHVQPLVAVLLQETGVLNTAQFVDMEVERFGLEVLHEVVHDYRCCERLLTATPDMAGTLLDKTELTQCDLTVDDNFNVVDVRTRGATFSPMDDLNALRESIHRRLSGYIRPRSPKQPLSDKAVQFDPACRSELELAFANIVAGVGTETFTPALRAFLQVLDNEEGEPATGAPGTQDLDPAYCGRVTNRLSDLAGALLQSSSSNDLPRFVASYLAFPHLASGTVEVNTVDERPLELDDFAVNCLWVCLQSGMTLDECKAKSVALTTKSSRGPDPDVVGQAFETALQLLAPDIMYSLQMMSIGLPQLLDAWISRGHHTDGHWCAVVHFAIRLSMGSWGLAADFLSRLKRSRSALRDRSSSGFATIDWILEVVARLPCDPNDLLALTAYLAKEQ